MSEEIQLAKKYAVFSEEGFPLAFYSSEIHGDNIPENSVEITSAQWQEFIDNAGFRKWRDGQVIEYKPVVTREQKWHAIRAKRDALLAASDWTILPDSPFTSAEKSAWKTYRQALRNLTENEDPDNITWPEKPD